nr:hypothetical protein [Oscillospiraceae bacterium]
MNKRESVFVNMSSLASVIEEKISDGGSVELSIRGVSMRPLLREGKDSVVLSPLMGRLKKGDIALFRRNNGAYVLHRVAKVADSRYSFVGDNQYFLEPVIDAQIIAVVSAIRRDGRLFECGNFAYRVYAFLWQTSRPLRFLLFRILRKLKKILKIA